MEEEREGENVCLRVATPLIVVSTAVRRQFVTTRAEMIH